MTAAADVSGDFVTSGAVQPAEMAAEWYLRTKREIGGRISTLVR